MANTKKQKKYTWRIYYGDGTTFDNTMGAPNEAPPVNVQAIVCYDPDVGKMVLNFWDWYYYRYHPGDDACYWWGCDLHGLLDQLLWDSKATIRTVKQGRTLKNSEFKKIYNRARNDPDFPQKSAEQKIERPRQAYGEGRNG